MSEVASQMIKVEIDLEADLAYVRFTDQPVARTVEVDEAIQIDMDQYNVAVGIEILDLDADIPFQQLVSEFHVRPEHVEILRMLRPNMKTSLQLGRRTDSTTTGLRVGVPC
jgi:uncharacterized protein YuzE